MTWFKVDHHVLGHPATIRVGNAALGAWLRAGCWLATFPKQDDFIPEHMWRLFGSRRDLNNLVDAQLLSPIDGGYAMRRTMNVCGSGLMDSFWEIGRKDGRAGISARLREFIYSRDGWACVECGCADDLTLDHIHPWSKGGTDTADNLRTLCRSCNSRKGARV